MCRKMLLVGQMLAEPYALVRLVIIWCSRQGCSKLTCQARSLPAGLLPQQHQSSIVQQLLLHCQQ